MSTTQSPESVELAKFFEVSARQFEAGRPTPQMFCPVIDAAWHRMMHTAEYAEFSIRHAGQLLGHASSHGKGRISWISAYEARYGPLPEIWFTGSDGRIDETRLTHYRQTGEVVAEWDCSPVPVPGEGDDVTPRRRKVTAS
ncbi:hypothetical protein [Streptomyces sp. NPDC059080]|uniref:hypothetical protein n=1 Tax=Streptomyces sp. NPDC059080 TaxID=3346718 RepID=UPI003684D45A